MIRYYANTETRNVEPVECPDGGHNLKDAHGRTQYTNTHFDDPEKAWEKLGREIDAHVQSAASALTQAETQLGYFRERAAEACKAMARFIENRDARKR